MELQYFEVAFDDEESIIFAADADEEDTEFLITVMLSNPDVGRDQVIDDLEGFGIKRITTELITL